MQPTLDMAKDSKTPITILRKGLDTLKQQVQTHKASLEARLRKKETLSDADEQWLDNDVNVIDEQQLLLRLDTVRSSSI